MRSMREMDKIMIKKGSKRKQRDVRRQRAY